MSTLEEIEDALHTQGGQIRELLEMVQQMQKPPEPPEPIPEVYLPPTEVQRLLSISAPTLLEWVKYGLITKQKNPLVKRKSYLLSEVLWMKSQGKYTHLTPTEMKRMISKKEKELFARIK